MGEVNEKGESDLVLQEGDFGMKAYRCIAVAQIIDDRRKLETVRNRSAIREPDAYKISLWILARCMTERSVLQV